MIQGFEKLSVNQFQSTKDAIVWITILIAGADGEIDNEEKEWAAKVTKIRGYHNPNELTPFYEAVGAEFSDKLEALLKEIPSDVNERTALFTRKIEQLNSILPLLNGNLGHYLSQSYRTFALHVAKATGGFLGFMSVSNAESKLVDLPMLDKIEFIDLNESEEE